MKYLNSYRLLRQFSVPLYYIIAIFILSLPLSSLSQNQLTVYKNLTSAHGLPSDFIYDIDFDENGFLWMASPLGLIKYDGKNYKTPFLEYPDFENKEWNIKNICTLGNKIWYTDIGGQLFNYNIFNHSNTPYDFDESIKKSIGNNSLTFMYKDIDKNLWIGVKNKGVLFINTASNNQIHYSHNDTSSNCLLSNNVNDLCQDKNGNYWFATNEGLCVLDMSNNTFHQYTNNPLHPHLLLSNKLQSIIIDSSGFIWIGTSGYGLFRLDPTKLMTKNFVYKENDFSTISHNYINDLFLDNNNILWVSTHHGLNCIDLSKTDLFAVRYLKKGVNGLTSNKINDVEQSSEGNIWVATNGGGINVIQNKNSRFINKDFNANNETLRGLPIICLETDDKNRVWISTIGEGILVFNADGSFDDNYSNKLNSLIQGVYKQSVSLEFLKGEMFLSCGHLGLFSVDLRNDSPLKIRKHSINNIPVKDIYIDRNSNKWILSNTGAYCFSHGKLIDSIVANSPSSFITQDYRGKIWLGTKGDGLWIYQPKNKELNHYKSTNKENSIIGDYISSIYEDNTGIMWVGTSDGGLCYFDRNYSQFLPFYYNSRVMSSNIFSIIEDNDEFLWVASEYGLLKIDDDKKESILFGHGQGILRNEFNPRAVLKDKSGKLFFGTENGLLSFNPRKVELVQEFPKLKFTDFLVFNKSIFDLYNAKVKDDFIINSKIKLKNDENFIGIEFVGLNLDYPEHIRFKYRLLGFENNWVYSRNNNFVSYLNIPSGDYKFQLSSTNKDGIWNPELLELEIEIQTPVYLRTWFVVLISLILLLIILSVIVVWLRYSSRRHSDLTVKVEDKTRQLKEFNAKLQQEVEERKNAEESAENANKTKSLFLANMSHEIRTPMNSIIGFADLLSSLVKDDKQRHYLESIKSSGRSLLVLINDILDLSKIEAGKFEIEYQPVNLRSLFEEIKQVFALKCDEKDLIFDIEVDSKIPQTLILSDTRLRQIFVNIVGNAIKFTERGSVTMKVKQIASPLPNSKVNMQIDIVDTGVGIPEEQQQNIFHAFHQQEGQEFTKYGGTGLGLTISKRLMELMGGKIKLTSKVNEGTTFSLYLNDVPVSEDIEMDTQQEVFATIAELDLSKYSILIVDDSEANRSLIKEFLLPTGAVLYEAGNGQEAFEKTKELAPSIVFLDIRMPVMNGLETAKAIRAHESVSNIPLVAFTASISYNDSNKYKKAGFNDVLLKPVQMDELAAVLTSQLGISSEIQEPVEILGSGLEESGFENIRVIDLKAALQELKEMDAEWEFAKTNRFVNVVLEFSGKLIEIGEEYSVKAISRYGQELKINAQNFNTEKMEKSLNAFPSLVEELNSYLND